MDETALCDNALCVPCWRPRENAESIAQNTHELWLNDQKRFIKESRVKKAVAKELGISTNGGAGEYDPEDGFHVAFDFIYGIQRRVKRVQLVYGLFAASTAITPVFTLPENDTEEDPMVRRHPWMVAKSTHV